MDIRSLEESAKAIGEVGDRLEEWSKSADRVADSISTLIQKMGKAVGMEEKEVARRVTESQITWSEIRANFKTQLEEVRKKLLDTLAEMIRRGNC